jgi:hypothetical protein
MTALFKNTPIFASAYLALMIPTYVLPYFGSNSAIVNGLGAGLGRGLTPMWWLHAWFLVMLVVIASLRGKGIGKRYLLLFPALATAFDLVPLMNMVPLVPTVMHLAAIILGVTGTAPASDVNTDAAVPAARGEAWAAGLMSLVAVLGSWQFSHNTKQTINSMAPPRVERAQPSAAIPTPPSPAEAPAPALKAPETVKPLAQDSRKPVVMAPPQPIAKKAPEQPPKPPEAAPKVRLININD